MALELRTALLALEDLLGGGEIAWAKVAALGSPADLEQLFAVQLAALVRRGPAAGNGGEDGPLDPARLLAAAQQGARRGALSLACPGGLRQTLYRLASEVRLAAAWDPGSPLWWEPLPPPSALEWRWQELAGGGAGGVLQLPSSRQLAQAFGDPLAPEGTAGDLAPPRWLALQGLLPQEWLGPLGRELARADEQGLLALERAGVGSAGDASARRADSVCYLSGREPELLAGTPTLAALVQALLGPVGERLARGLRGGAAWPPGGAASRLAPPQRAMLARYPAPSEGYHPHLDNPGRATDNGRAATLVLYLNPAERQPAGGEIVLWAAGTRVSGEPAAVLPARGGSAVLFDSRAVPHQVRPLAPGPERWALTLWLQDRDEATAVIPPAAPYLRANEVLLPVEAPPLPAGSVLAHDLGRRAPFGRILVLRSRIERPPRVGLVSTVYGAGEALAAWCEHHFQAGLDHILLVFDRLEEPAESSLAAGLSERFGAERLTVWAGSDTEVRRWGLLLEDLELLGLLPLARAGASSWAVAARQTLNATAALAAARAGELGGAPLDWLLHLDADELLVPQGAGRGGETLRRHFAAATRAQVRRLRYLNHELLREGQEGENGHRPRFKLNPRLAAARLGTGGWQTLVSHLEMAPTDPRPYFTGYRNGKSAVAVGVARAAGGVHGWNLLRPVASEADLTLAGPVVLHLHPPDAATFAAKYLARAASPPPPGPVPFRPSPVEEAALGLIRRLQAAGVDDDVIRQRLLDLHARLTTFQPEEIEVLEEAGLLLEAGLPLEGGEGWGSDLFVSGP